MLEKSDLAEEKIIAWLLDEFGLQVNEVAFLPLGADTNTAVYHITTPNNSPYFLKLRSGTFDETAVTLPKYLHDRGIRQIIPPLPTKNGRLWGQLEQYTAVLYPYIAGRDGYEAQISGQQWSDLGTALRKIHTAEFPPDLLQHIRRETFGPDGRDRVAAFLARLDDEVYEDPVAIQLAEFLKTKRSAIHDLLSRSTKLARRLQEDPPQFIVCHSDLHAGNIFLGNDGELYIVDWDEPILAPKERDLMYIGGGLLASGLASQEEEALFYPAYGPAEINPAALAYYRYERIIQDIMEYCKQLFWSADGGADRRQALHYLQSNFLPGQTIAIAYQTDRTGEFRPLKRPMADKQG